MGENRMSEMKKPLPLKPKPDRKRATKKVPNRYSYLTVSERAYLAGLMDGCGRIFNGRVLKTATTQRLITYKVQLRSSQNAVPGIERAAEMLNLPIRDYRSSGSGRREIAIPHECIDDLMAALKAFISPGKYNAYVRAKYLSDLSAFKLGQAVTVYGSGNKSKRLYKGVDWQGVDKLMEQPDITPALLKAIEAAKASTQSLVTESL